MTLEPDPVPAQPSAEPHLAPASQPTQGRRSFGSRLLGLAFVIFCFELGVFLVVFPWLGELWQDNNAPVLAPWLEPVWGSPFFRGALSGLGLVNLYISFVEMVRLVRNGAPAVRPPVQ